MALQALLFTWLDKIEKFDHAYLGNRFDSYCIIATSKEKKRALDSKSLINDRLSNHCINNRIIIIWATNSKYCIYCKYASHVFCSTKKVVVGYLLLRVQVILGLRFCIKQYFLFINTFSRRPRVSSDIRLLRCVYVDVRSLVVRST